MSWQPAQDPACDIERRDAVETMIVPRARDIGGFEVRRALPAVERRMVGPFVFLDQMGPAEFAAGHGIDVRPHPHIGLATVTYLFEGEILHRDSLGTVQPIRPGELNWMTAGRGIAHSERTGSELRAKGSRMFGVQAWVAPPREHEETEPSFVHHASAELPVISGEGKRVRVIAGGLFGEHAPTETLHETLYADAALARNASLPLDAGYEERAIYIVEGAVEIAGRTFDAGRLLVFRPGDAITVRAPSRARFMILGGDAMDGPRHIWWNFVSSSKDRIEQAKADWKAGRFAAVPDETEFIPLPD